MGASRECQVTAQAVQQLLLGGYGRAMDLALGAGTGSSPGLLAPVGACLVTSDLIKVSPSCAGFVDSSISCHLHRSCSPCALSSAKGCSSALELTASLGQGRCPWGSLGGHSRRGIGAGPAPLLENPVQLHPPCGPRALWGPGLAPGWAGGGFRCPWPWEGSWDRGQSVCTCDRKGNCFLREVALD